MLAITWNAEAMELYPERAILWARMRTLIIADVHIAKAASFRAAGVPVPTGTTQETLARLTSLLARTRAERLIVLGDLIHAAAGRDHPAIDLVGHWRSNHASLEMVLVRGNHDRGAGDPPANWSMTCHDEPLIEEQFTLRHTPIESGDEYPTLAGHVHPVLTLRDTVGGGIRCRCFIFGKRSALLPAFGAFTGGCVVQPGPRDRAFAIGPDAVVEVSQSRAKSRTVPQS